MSALPTAARSILPVAIQRVIENVEHDDPENGNCDEAGGAGNRVVNAGRDTGVVFSDGTHYRRRQRCHAYRHA